ncbi:MAG: hypothetical protein EA356_14595 [Geminicoccaceae bacterium]|nr:MAG: hypothetical protein EA356_14595 [Geminicoccaceae bacterium]
MHALPDANLETSDGRLVMETGEAQAGFLICSATTPKLRVLYADVNARWLFAGRPLVGMPLTSLFEAVDDQKDLQSAFDALASGATVYVHQRLRLARHGLHHVAMRLQPLVGGDGNEPWALCSFEAAASDGGLAEIDASPALPSLEASPNARSAAAALDLATFVEDLAHRLQLLLPGDVRVATVKPVDPLWVDAPGDALEEIVACLLALATPLDPWRYAVRLVVREDRGADTATLGFALEGDVGGSMARSPLPGCVQTRLEELGLGLVTDVSLGADAGLALVMRLARTSNGHRGNGTAAR